MKKIYLSVSAYFLSILFLVSILKDIAHLYEHANHIHKRCFTSGAEKHFHNEEYSSEHCTLCLFHNVPKELYDASFIIGLKPIIGCEQFRHIEVWDSISFFIHYPLRGPPQFA